MQTFLTILFWILCGITCAYYAKKKGKNPILWFFIGLFCGAFGVIFLFFMPVKKPEESPVAVPPYLPPITPSVLKKSWYYLDKENKPLGPMTEEKLRNAFDEGTISVNTYIWNEEMEDWKTLQEVSPFTKA